LWILGELSPVDTIRRDVLGDRIPGLVDLTGSLVLPLRFDSDPGKTPQAVQVSEAVQRASRHSR
jgi:hypothetical protein